MSEPPFMQTARVALEQRKVAAVMEVSKHAQLDVLADAFTDNLMFRLESYVLSEHLVGDTEKVNIAFSHPATPWQHWKRDHAEHDPVVRWIARRWPVRYATEIKTRSVKFDRYATYPESTLRVPELGRPVVMESFTTYYEGES